MFSPKLPITIPVSDLYDPWKVCNIFKDIKGADFKGEK